MSQFQFYSMWSSIPTGDQSKLANRIKLLFIDVSYHRYGIIFFPMFNDLCVQISNWSKTCIYSWSSISPFLNYQNLYFKCLCFKMALTSDASLVSNGAWFEYFLFRTDFAPVIQAIQKIVLIKKRTFCKYLFYLRLKP